MGIKTKTYKSTNKNNNTKHGCSMHRHFVEKKKTSKRILKVTNINNFVRYQKKRGLSNQSRGGLTFSN